MSGFWKEFVEVTFIQNQVFFVRESVIEYGYLFNVLIITFHVALCLTNSRMKPYNL